jgi:predicted lipid-binding transport protein (Tim44 family)
MEFDSSLVMLALIVAALLLNHDSIAGAPPLAAPGAKGGAPNRPEQNRPVRLVPAAATAADHQLARTLDDIRLSDASFEPGQFLEGARIVYGTAVIAFAQGDRALLRELSSPDVFQTFSEAIAARNARRERVELRIVRVQHAAIVEAELFDNVAQVTAGFTTELVRAIRSESGAVIAGDPDAIVSTADHWTFEKTLETAGSAWKLVATAPAHKD